MSGKTMLWFKWIVLPGLLVFASLRTALVFADLCLADINADGKVDGSDMQIMVVEMGRDNCFTEPCKADLNNDGKVDDKDMIMYQTAFKSDDCVSSGEVIPGEQIEMPLLEQEVEFLTGEEEEVPSDIGAEEEIEGGEAVPETRSQ